MKERIVTEFKYACKTYLSTLSISSLRTYGRNKGVAQPTTMKKEDLIDLIVSILAGETRPQIRNNKGAPVKDKDVDPKIDEAINRIYHTIIEKYQSERVKTAESEEGTPMQPGGFGNVQREILEFQKNQKVVLRVEDPNAEKYKTYENGNRIIYKGQLQVMDGVAMLLPLHCKGKGDRLIVPIEIIRRYDLREGDIVSCYAELSRTALIVTDILTINELVTDSFHRGKFEELDICYPSRRIKTYNGALDSVTGKYLQWLMPLGKGQRACVCAPPKTGNTCFLLDLIQNIASVPQNLTVFGLLVGQPVENVVPFRKLLGEENLVYTTYEDSPEQQVFCADFMLNRLKRLSESGKDVLLCIDCLNNLAKAYNETESSMGGKTLGYGLESKTLHYIKKFFGSARCFEKGGSLTIVAALSIATGNPVDDLLSAEILRISNHQIQLEESLAKQRIYPAIGLLHSKWQVNLQTEEEKELDTRLYKEFLPKYGEEGLHEAVEKADSIRALLQNVNG